MVGQGGNDVEVRRLGVRPHQPRVDLVADLNPANLDPGAFKGGEDVESMLINIILELRHIVGSPGGGLDLVARIGPGVRIVEVDHNPLTKCRGSPRLSQDIGNCVVTPGRIDPNPEPDRIDAEIGKQNKRIGFNSSGVVESGTIRFLFSYPTNVCT